MKVIRQGKKAGAVEMSKADITALLAFTSKDAKSPHLHCIVIREGGVFATDGHTAVASTWEPVEKISFEAPAMIDRAHVQLIRSLVPQGGIVRIRPLRRVIKCELINKNGDPLATVVVDRVLGCIPPPIEDVLRPPIGPRRSVACDPAFLARLSLVLRTVPSTRGVYLESSGLEDDPLFAYVDGDDGERWTVAITPMRLGERESRRWEGP